VFSVLLNLQGGFTLLVAKLKALLNMQHVGLPSNEPPLFPVEQLPLFVIVKVSLEATNFFQVKKFQFLTTLSVQPRVACSIQRARQLIKIYIVEVVFFDHASGFVSVEFQSSLSSHATLASKVSFEQMCHDYGVMPQKYLSDNGGAFTSKEYSDHLSAFHQ
jgi:hypothetical protein